MSISDGVIEFNAMIFELEQTRQETGLRRPDVLNDPKCVSIVQSMEDLVGSDETIARFYLDGVRHFQNGDAELLEPMLGVVATRTQSLSKSGLLTSKRSQQLEKQLEDGSAISYESIPFFRMFRHVLPKELLPKRGRKPKPEAIEEGGPQVGNGPLRVIIHREGHTSQKRLKKANQPQKPKPNKTSNFANDDEYVSRYRTKPTEHEKGLNPLQVARGRLRELRLEPKVKTYNDARCVKAIMVSRHLRSLSADEIDEDVANRMIDQCFSFVTQEWSERLGYVLLSYRQNTYERNEIVKAAALRGLGKAFDRFDESRGFAFATFADRTIRGEIRHALRDDTIASGTMRRSDWQTYSMIEGLKSLGYSEDRVAKELGIDEAHVRQVLTRRNANTHRPIDTTDPVTTNRINVVDPSQELVAELIGLGQTLGELELSYQDIKIIWHAFGIKIDSSTNTVSICIDSPRLSQTEIAKNVGLSQSYVSRRIRGIVRQIRAADLTSAS